MSPLEIGIIGVVVLFVLIALGLPIGVAMGMIAVAGLALITNIEAALGRLGQTAFSMTANYLTTVIPMFVMMPVLKEPQSAFATWMSLLPPFTPFLMLLRQSTPTGVPVWQPWVGLLGVLSFTMLYVWAGGRIFRIAILMQGTPPKLTNIIRWALRG